MFGNSRRGDTSKSVLCSEKRQWLTYKKKMNECPFSMESETAGQSEFTSKLVKFTFPFLLDDEQTYRWMVMQKKRIFMGQYLINSYRFIDLSDKEVN